MVETQVGPGELVRLLTDMEALRRFLRLYPEGHPALGPARDRLAQSVRTLVPAGDIVISLAPDHFYWNEERVHLATGQPARQMVRLLFDLGIGAVRLQPGQAEPGFVDLAELLARLREPVGQGERDEVLQATKGFAGIELVPLDLSTVQGVSIDEAENRTGTRLVWAELAGRLGRDGAFTLAGCVDEGELTPGSVATAAKGSSAPETLFDFLFAELAQGLEDVPLPSRPPLLAEIREFLSKVLRLLEPDNRALAVAVGVRHLPLIDPERQEDESLLGSELVLDSVEALLRLDRPVPEVLQRAIYRMAAPASRQSSEIPSALIGRARNLLPRLPLVSKLKEVEPVQPTGDHVETSPWAHLPWASELRRLLDDDAVRRHVVKVLGEVLAVSPQNSDASTQAAGRLADEFVAALELGDFDTASRLTPTVASPRHASVNADAFEAGVAATVRGFGRFDRSHHAVLTAILTTLGNRALPQVLEHLATVENLGVRKRLLEVVLRQGIDAIPAVRKLLTDQRWFVVRNAVFLLRKLGAREALPTIKKLLPAARPQIVSEILKTLIALGDPEWLRLLTAELDSPDPKRRTAVLSVASRVPHPALVQHIISRLRDLGTFGLKDPFARELIQTLGRLKDPSALEILRPLAAASGWRGLLVPRPIRVEAAAAIARLTGQDAQREARRIARRGDADLALAVKTALLQADLPEEDL